MTKPQVYTFWCDLWYNQVILSIDKDLLSRASKGFDRDREAGEASRMAMRQMAKLNLNANNQKLALAA